MLILIENGEVYAPEPQGPCSVLLVGDRVGVVGRGALELREVIAGGRRLVRGGEFAFAEKSLEESNRSVRLRGGKAGGRGEAPDPAS